MLISSLRMFLSNFLTLTRGWHLEGKPNCDGSTDVRLESITTLVWAQEEAVRFTQKSWVLRALKMTLSLFRSSVDSPCGQRIWIWNWSWRNLGTSHDEQTAETLLTWLGRISHDGVWTRRLFRAIEYRKTCEELRTRRVKLLSKPKEIPYTVMAIFEDLYRNHVFLQ